MSGLLGSVGRTFAVVVVVYQGLRRPRQGAALPKSLPSSERIWTCGGCTRSGIAGVNSFKSQPKQLHPGAKVWIAEIRRRVPQPRPRQWSAEAITVSGIIITNVEVDDRGSNQVRQLKIIPQLKSHNLAGVFRYWLEAIRTVIDSTLSPAVQFKLALTDSL